MSEKRAEWTATLESGVFFRLTSTVVDAERDAGGRKRTVLVSYWPTEQPAVPPQDRSPVRRFQGVVTGRHYSVTDGDIDALHRVPFAELPPAVTHTAVDLLVDALLEDRTRVPTSDLKAAIARGREAETSQDVPQTLNVAQLVCKLRPDAFGEIVGPTLSLLAESGATTATATLLCSTVATLGHDRPATLRPHVDKLTTIAATDSALLAPAISCLMTVAESDRAAALDGLPTIAAAAESDDEQTRRLAIYTLSVLAEEYPEAVYPTISVLTEAIRDDEETRTNALSALGKISGSYPDAGQPIVEELRGLLEADQPQVRANAAGLLGDIATVYPEPVIEAAPALASRLADDCLDVRINASITLLRAGEADPAAIRREHEPLKRALEDENSTVRANACTLIGNSNAPVAIGAVYRLQVTDPNERVRERAAWAVSQLR